MTAALWILHCWVFDQFTITPRLALLSPVRGCGKTTLLAFIGLLTAEPLRTDNTSAAPIYYLLDTRPNTMLLHFSTTFTTVAFDDSSLRWLEINT
jgi:hypothetical protein